MIQKIFLKAASIVSPVLIIMMLISCSASEHAGIAYKKKPSLKETNEDVWFEYWQDQLDARRGRVISPPSNYPKVAHSAYNRAVQDWNIKVLEANRNTYIAYAAVSLGIAIIVYIIVASSAPTTPVYTY